MSGLSQKQKVLFFDDDPVTQRLVKAALEDSFDVICETSSEAALESVALIEPHIILLDLNMPHVDGFEILKRIKAHPILATIPVICVSGQLDKNSRARAFSLGAAGFIPKPIDVIQISSDIQALVKAMNAEFVSSDHGKQMFIGFNSNETMQRLKRDLKSMLSDGEKVVLISLQKGSVFFSPNEFQGELENGHILYLQMKQNLVLKIQQLEDLSPLIQEIKEFLGENCSSRHLLFEGPERIIDVSVQDKFLSSAVLLAEALNKAFKSVRYYSRAYQEPQLIANLNSIAKILVSTT